MPVYNREKTVGKAIELVLNQTHENFRLIIVDDGSRDGTEEVCRKYLNDEWMPWHLDFLLNELEQNDKLDIIGSKIDADRNKLQGGIKRNNFNNLSGEELWFKLA